ncbi:MAG TPA: iron chelate uptake ABC transporter family permease subunit [Methanocorpusculum sp.]|nr:iron chelate uptake ABC transporter family permease subunit [Methanocorpusculum sp.]
MLKRPILLIPLLTGILLVVTGVSLCFGDLGFGFGGIFDFSSELMQNIIFNIRLPRILGAVIVGAGLAAAGCAMQGLFRNPIADPYLLGTSSGGSLGAAISIIFLDGMFTPILAFIGAILSTMVVYFASQRKGRVSVETLLLTGIAMSFLLSAMLSFIVCISNGSLQQIMFFTMGGLGNVLWDDVLIGLLILTGSFILFFFSRDMNIMSLGEEKAVHMGVSIEKTKCWLLLISTFITAITVSIGGCIGVVGLIVPHIVRLLTGPNHKILLPASMLSGSLLLVIADTFARSLHEIPVGIITAFFSAPFFIYLLRRRSHL